MLQGLILLLMILGSQATLSGHTVVCVCNPAHSCAFVSKSCTYFSDFSSALSNAKLRNNTEIRLAPAVYNLQSYSASEGNFWHRTNISIVGEGSAGAVVIKCHTGAGLGFFNSSRIKIENVTFCSCAKQQNSTTPDNIKKTSVSFINISVALYFLKCQDVQISYVTIKNSCGIGLIFYNTIGNNYLHYVNFAANRLSHSSQEPGGGGAVIEYSYCNPEDPAVSCLDYTLYNNTNFSLQHCVFSDNNSTAGKYSFLKRYSHPNVTHQAHFGFGRGGGLSISLSGNINNTQVDINQCSFTRNQAILGGGLFIKIDEVATAASITIRRSNFSSNGYFTGCTRARNWSHGGAVSIMLVTNVGNNYQKKNAIGFRHCTFKNNAAETGGALSILITKAKAKDDEKILPRLAFRWCYFQSNIADIGAAMHFSTMLDKSNGFLPIPYIDNCTFEHNVIVNTTKQFIGMGSVYTDTVPVHIAGDTRFLFNNGSALVVSATSVQFENDSNLTFFGNSGNKGGAVALLNRAWMQVEDFSSLNFTGNKAHDAGGAIYFDSSGEENLIYRRFWKCFIRHHYATRMPDTWNVSFYFDNNMVSKYGESYLNSIYAVSIQSCVVQRNNESFKDAMHMVFCWENWNFTNSCKHDIMTSPASMNWTKSTFETYPGEVKSLPLLIMDDKGVDITSNVILNAYISSGPARLEHSFHLVTNNSLAIFQNSSDSQSELVIETTGTRKLYNTITVKMHPCPPGMVLDKQECKCLCGDLQFGGVVDCYYNDSRIIRRIKSDWCMSLWRDEEQDQNVTVVVVGPWMFSSQLNVMRTMKLPDTQSALDEEMCGQLNRTGPLCSHCKEGYGVAVFSLLYQCVKCKNPYASWLIYGMVEFVPITLFFLIIVLLNININSGKTNALIFYCQMVALPANVNQIYHNIEILFGPSTSVSYILLNIVILPYSLWNLDILRTIVPPFCLSQNLRMIDALALDYITAIYPLLLVILCYALIELHGNNFRLVVWMWRPFAKCFGRFRRQWNLQTSVIEAFATFLVLSYTKFANVSVSLLVPNYVRDSSGNMFGKYVLFFDASINYSSWDHFPYFVLALVIMVFVVILPPLFLILYPMKWFRSLLECWRIRGPAVTTFADAFQWCYKDGTNGMPDRRFISAIYFFFRLVSVVLMVSIPDLKRLRFWQLLATLVAFLGFAVLHPYKKDIYNYTDCAFAFMLSSILAYSQFLSHDPLHTKEYSSLFILLLMMPLIYMFFLPINEIYKRVRQKIHCNKPKRVDYLASDEENFLENHHTDYGATNVTYTEVTRCELSGSYPDRLLNPETYSIN